MSSSPPRRPTTHPPSTRPMRSSRAPEPLRRCPVHDLALSSEGACLRCGGIPRRRSRPQTEPLLTEVSTRTKLTWALVAACALGGLLMLSGRQNDESVMTPRGLRVTSEEAPPAEAQAATAPSDAHRSVSVPVVMYSTTWCGACRSARAYLDAHNLPYTEHDVESNAGARAEQLRLNPRGSVPTLDVGGEVMVGFNELAFEQALDAAAARQARSGLSAR